MIILLAHTLIGRPVEDFVMAQGAGKSAGNELKEHYYDKVLACCAVRMFNILISGVEDPSSC